MTIEITQSPTNKVDIVIKKTKSAIAFKAKQTAHFSGIMIMVDLRARKQPMIS